MYGPPLGMVLFKDPILCGMWAVELQKLQSFEHEVGVIVGGCGRGYKSFSLLASPTLSLNLTT